MKKFSNLVLELFKEPLANYGFKRELKKTEKYSCKIIYGNNDRYVKISANVHPRDYPPYFNIVLGEGERDILEADWNSIALWRLKNYILKNENSREYNLKEPEKVRQLLIHSRNELFEYGLTFLSGDVLIFREVRALQNKNREPYKIHSVDKHGKHITVDDPKSSKLKKKYS